MEKTLSPFGGYLADRFGRSRVIVWSLLAWSAIIWQTAHVTTFPEFVITRALMGISEAAYLPAALALITDYHRGTTRSFANGVHLTGIMAGAGLGGLGGWIAERHTWNYAFSMFGFIGLAYGVVLILLLRDAPKTSEAGELPAPAGARVDFLAAFVSLFARRSYIVALIFWSILGTVGWVVVGWMPTFIMERFELTQGVAGLSTTGYMQAAAFAGLLIGGAWADRWSRTNNRARILVPFVGMCAATPAIFLAANTSVLFMALAGLVTYALAKAFADVNMMPILCQVTDEKYRATGYGVLNMTGGLVGGTAIYAGGAMRDGNVNLSRVFQCATAGMALAALMVYLVRLSPTTTPGQV